MRKEDHVCQHVPACLVRQTPSVSKERPETQEGRKKMQHSLFLCTTRGSFSLPPPFKHNSFILIKSPQGLNMRQADRACCIFVPSLGNSPGVARERAHNKTPEQERERCLVIAAAPSGDQPHTGLVVRRAKLAGRPSIANLPSCSSSFFPSCLTVKRSELRVSSLSSWEWADSWCLC